MSTSTTWGESEASKDYIGKYAMIRAHEDAKRGLLKMYMPDGTILTAVTPSKARKMARKQARERLASSGPAQSNMVAGGTEHAQPLAHNVPHDDPSRYDGEPLAHAAIEAMKSFVRCMTEAAKAGSHNHRPSSRMTIIVERHEQCRQHLKTLEHSMAGSPEAKCVVSLLKTCLRLQENMKRMIVDAAFIEPDELLEDVCFASMRAYLLSEWLHPGRITRDSKSSTVFFTPGIYSSENVFSAGMVAYKSHDKEEWVDFTAFPDITRLANSEVHTVPVVPFGPESMLHATYGTLPFCVFEWDGAMQSIDANPNPVQIHRPSEWERGELPVAAKGKQFWAAVRPRHPLRTRSKLSTERKVSPLNTAALCTNVMPDVFEAYEQAGTPQERAERCSAKFFDNSGIRFSRSQHELVTFHADAQTDASELLLALAQCDDRFFSNCVYVESTSRVCGLALTGAERESWTNYKKPKITVGGNLLTIVKTVFESKTGTLTQESKNGGRSYDVVSDDNRIYGCGIDWGKDDVDPPAVFTKASEETRAVIHAAIPGEHDRATAVGRPDRVIETTTTYVFGPFVLVMLKRYEMSGETAAKILAEKVEMPLKVTVTLGDAPYDLASTLYHLGDAWTSGHYVAKVAVGESSENVTEYLCDDHDISDEPTRRTDDSATSWEKSVGPPERPYMLLYKRREVPWLDKKPLPIANPSNSCYANALVQFLRPLTVNLESVRRDDWYEAWAASVAAGGATHSATSR